MLGGNLLLIFIFAALVSFAQEQVWVDGVTTTVGVVHRLFVACRVDKLVVSSEPDVVFQLPVGLKSILE